MRRDELHDPLGLEPQSPRARGAFGLWTWSIAGAAVTIAGLAGLYVARRPAAEPPASARIVRLAKPSVPSAPSAPAVSPTTTNSIGSSGGESDIEEGVRVVRGGAGPASAPRGAIIHVPSADDLSVALVPAPDPRLVEPSRFGPLPKVGADGSRPFSVYRRMSDAKPNAPRLALVITGMGLNSELTRAAASELPPAITFAFAPFGDDLQDLVAQARGAGHEILLQAPMEPLAAEGAAWPHELTTKADAARNVADLHWSMSQFAGYFGMMNFMGSKLTADRSAMAPILKDLASRGLAYVDDGTSPLSVAPALAGDLRMPTARADLTIDASGDPDAIDAALAKLEALARARGSALGIAAGLPSMIERLSQLKEKLAAAGVVLVPASALVATTAVVTSTK